MSDTNSGDERGEFEDEFDTETEREFEVELETETEDELEDEFESEIEAEVELEGGFASEDDGESNALLSRLRVIEDQPLETRAESFAQVHEELRNALEAGDS